MNWVSFVRILITIAKKYHPDTMQGEEKKTDQVFILTQLKFLQDKFKEITEAYQILGDTEKRARYNRLIFGDSASSDFDN